MITIPDGISLAMSATRAELTRRLSAATAKVPYVQKTGKTEGRSSFWFASDRDLVDAVRPFLVEQDIAISMSSRVVDVVERQTGGGATMRIYTVELTVMLSCGDEWIASRHVGCGEDNQDRGPAKAITDAKKSWLRAAFLIPTGDEPEIARRPQQQSGQQAHAQAQVAKEVQDAQAPAQAQAAKEVQDAAATAATLLSERHGWTIEESYSRLRAEVLAIKDDGPATVQNMRDALKALMENSR